MPRLYHNSIKDRDRIGCSFGNNADTSACPGRRVHPIHSLGVNSSSSVHRCLLTVNSCSSCFLCCCCLLRVDFISVGGLLPALVGVVLACSVSVTCSSSNSMTVVTTSYSWYSARLLLAAQTQVWNQHHMYYTYTGRSPFLQRLLRLVSGNMRLSKSFFSR